MTTSDARELLVGRTLEVCVIDGEPTITDARPELTFHDDGRITGMASINRVMGQYSMEGDRVTVGPLGMTMMAGDPEAMAQEQRLVAALAAPLTVSVEGDGTVVLANGTVTVELCEVREPDVLTITGTVVYPQRIALPDDAVTTVTLEDVARADAPARQLATCVIHGGQVPLPFTLTVSGSGLAELGNHVRLAVRARIESDGRLLWITDEHHGVEPDANVVADLMLRVVQVS